MSCSLPLVREAEAARWPAVGGGRPGGGSVEGVGKRPMVPPDDPRHPANVQKAQAGMTG